MRKTLLIASVIYLFFSSVSTAQSLPTKFRYGVTGHPLTQESYQNNLDLQISLLKKLNVKFYRIDVPIDSTGAVPQEAKFIGILKKLQANGIRVLPVLVFNRSFYKSASAEAANRAGLNYGKKFAQTYKRYFDYYEVGNEEANGIIQGPQVDGNILAHYDVPKSNLLMAYFKGVCNALKAEDPSAKLVINEGWVHYGFFQLLRDNGVKYDIIGYHGYSEMGDLTNARRSFRNVMDTLYRKFRKPIWITEMNVWKGASVKPNQTSEQWFARNLRALRRNRHVEGIFIYELLDQPAFDNPASPYNSPGEAYYGLSAWQQRYKQVAKKPIFDVYKSFIQKYP